MKIGYARISSADQNGQMQQGALKAAGCEKIVTEQVSGLFPSRPKQAKLLRSIGKGNVLTIWRLDRLRRSLPQLIEVVRYLETKDAGFQSLSENIDTITAGDCLIVVAPV